MGRPSGRCRRGRASGLAGRPARRPLPSSTARCGCDSRTGPWEGPRLALPAPPAPGSTYTLRLWDRLAPGEAPASLKLTIERHTSGTVRYDTVVPDTPVTAGDWARLSGTYTLTHEATRLVLYAETVHGTAPFHIDDFTMTVSGPATVSVGRASPYGLTSVSDGELIRTVLLNAAGRPYCHCALETYPAGRFIGDELWIGAKGQQLLTELLRRR
ncbi:carbohydrate binding domain-containing protein [Streptomyces sp. NPDC053560]|uniref:carbohydrate binding domain-containing protein n=1 Tax=Streptomyces sp. NPDC053560 TaxID=3365711 RepID=UPI0037D03D13